MPFFGLLFLVLGILLVRKGLKSLSAKKRLIAEMTPVNGTVLSWAKTEDRDADGRISTYHTPTISFTTIAGESREFTSRVAVRFPNPAVGGILKLRYPESDPAQVVIDQAGFRYAGQVMTCICGVIMALAGLITLIAAL